MAYIDIYCERVGPGLLAEPVNALTNLAFFAVAWWLWRDGRERQAPSTRFLFALIVAIGIGSSLFHTFASLWARVLDEVPILLFQLTYIWVYLRRVAAVARLPAVLSLAAYLAAALYARQFPHLLNASLVYAPALGAMCALAIYHASMRQSRRWALAQAAAILLAAVFMRTIDAPLCDRFPLGTHFLWHLCVALAIYLSMQALLAVRPARSAIGSAAPPVAR